MFALVLVLVVKPYLFLAGEAVLGAAASADWRVDVDLVGGVDLTRGIALADFAAFAAGVLEAAVALAVGAGLSFAEVFEAAVALVLDVGICFTAELFEAGIVLLVYAAPFFAALVVDFLETDGFLAVDPPFAFAGDFWNIVATNNVSESVSLILPLVFVASGPEASCGSAFALPSTSKLELPSILDPRLFLELDFFLDSGSLKVDTFFAVSYFVFGGAFALVVFETEVSRGGVSMSPSSTGSLSIARL